MMEIEDVTEQEVQSVAVGLGTLFTIAVVVATILGIIAYLVIDG